MLQAEVTTVIKRVLVMPILTLPTPKFIEAFAGEQGQLSYPLKVVADASEAKLDQN